MSRSPDACHSNPIEHRAEKKRRVSRSVLGYETTYDQFFMASIDGIDLRLGTVKHELTNRMREGPSLSTISFPICVTEISTIQERRFCFYSIRWLFGVHSFGRVQKASDFLVHITE